MGFRNIVILFFATMTVSLVILLVLFNLVFKNIDLSFDTRTPESAPILEDDGSTPETSFKAGQTGNATVKVPGSPGSSAATTPSPAYAPVLPVASNPAPPPPDDQPTQLSEPPQTPAPPLVKTEPAPPPKKPVVVPPAAAPMRPPAPAADEPAPDLRLRPRAAAPAPTPPPASAPKALYQVYVDGFRSDADARAAADNLKSKGVEAFSGVSGGRPVVKLGTFSNRESAEAVAGQNGAKVRHVSP